jgi:hypothetical protein
LLLGTLGALVVVNVPVLGSNAWSFRPGPIHASGVLAPFVRAAHERFDLGILRSAAVLAGILVVALAAHLLAERPLRLPLAAASVAVAALLLLLPGVVLQAGLRDSTKPWFFTNDSTYQIEIAGQLVRDGSNPYGHDYGTSGLERFYSLDGTVRPATGERQVALRHFAYFPGTALAAAAWGALPKPFSDYRFLVLVCTLALLPAAFLFPGPIGTRLALGAVLAVNPLAVHAVWFGTADAPSLLALVLAFGLAARSRLTAAAGCLAAAVLLKQFALVAVPFFLVMFCLRVDRRRLVRPSGAFLSVLLAGFLPFFVADPDALWSDTVRYGAGTYRIIGYGLAALLLRAHALSSRTGYYPFVPLLLGIWLPVTAWLCWLQWRLRTLWVGAIGFAVSIFVLLFLARVFQTSYLVWPLTAGVLAALLAGDDDRRSYPVAAGLDYERRAASA